MDENLKINDYKISDYIDSNCEKLTGILAKLISFNTENDGKSGNETPLAKYLAEQYRLLGFEAETYCPDEDQKFTDNEQYLKGRNLRGRENVTAFIPGKNSRKSLMAAGHLDTVPAGDASSWTYPPFCAAVKDGKIYGRGANDDKSALAACLFIAGMFKELKIEPENDIYFTGYVDEEFGGGNGALAACVKYPCGFYINLDGENYEIWNTATGGQRIALHLKHKNSVSSCEDIIEGLYICKKHIDMFGEKRKSELKANKLYFSSHIADDALRYMAVSSGTKTSDKNRGIIDFAFYTDKDEKTIKCQLDEMISAISKDISKLNLEVENVEYKSRFFRYSECESEKEIKRLMSCAGKMTGKDIHAAVSPLSDLNLFMSLSGGKAMGFGVGGDFDIPGGPHQCDEYMEIEALKEMTKIMASYILEWDKDVD